MDTRHEFDRPAMRERAHELGVPEELILFWLGGLRFGIDIRKMREVARELPSQIPLVGTGCVIGMITLRGVSTAVVDLAVLLGTARVERTGRKKMLAVEHNGVVVCFLVDQIDGLHDVASGELEPPPPILSDVDVSWLDYVTRTTTGELVCVIDVDRILSQVADLEPAEVETVHG
jgi:purine-binding chemotaxis protein CheW